MHTELVYRTFSELVDAVRTDFKTLSLEGLIDEGDMVKVALRVNYELGLRVNPSKQVILEVENYKAKLPDDFYVLNFAAELAGRQQFEPTFNPAIYQTLILEEALRNLPFTTDKDQVKSFTIRKDLPRGDSFLVHNLDSSHVIVQVTDEEGHPLIVDFQQVTSDRVKFTSLVDYPNVDIVIIGQPDADPLQRLTIERDPEQLLVAVAGSRHTKRDLKTYMRYRILNITSDRSVLNNEFCIRNSSLQCNQAYIKKKHLITEFESGDVFLNYQGSMEDEEGNLLVLDHPSINEFYEYALKQRILENLIFNGEPQQNNLSLIEQRLRAARNNALTIVNTPDFAELKRTWEINRTRMYQKYYHIIAS